MKSLFKTLAVLVDELEDLVKMLVPVHPAVAAVSLRIRDVISEIGEMLAHSSVAIDEEVVVSAPHVRLRRGFALFHHLFSESENVVLRIHSYRYGSF